MPDVLRVDVQPQNVDVTPGGQPVVVQAKIFNGTTIIDEFKVTAMGTGQWLEVPPATVRLFPDKEDMAELSFAIPLGQFVPAGPRIVGIEVASTSNPALTSVHQITVNVAEVVAGEVMTLEPQIVRGSGSGSMTATVSNGGNSPMTLALSGQDAEGRAKLTFSPQRVEVPPGGQSTVRVNVSAPRAFFGKETQRQLTVKAEGAHTPLVANATFIQAPRFTMGWLRSLRAILTLVAGFAMIAGAFASWITSPETISGVKLDYVVYGGLGFNASLAPLSTKLSGDIVSFFTSAGFVTIFFAVLVILGLFTHTGKMTRVAGVLALVVILALFAVLFASPSAPVTPSVGAGAVLAAAGSLLAIIAGAIGT